MNDHEQSNASVVTGCLYRHRKRGSTYRIVGEANLQTSAPVGDNERLVVYQGDDGRIWVRPANEFFDGRFEKEIE
ncbi:DUF1653 domain-containing protein [Methylobacterium sp. 1030]|uniref:DUF1653 domain-containing protein n=1 Tax=Methylobacterium sp. 1030 TaxID=3156404 RepID=UPI00339449BE